MCGIVGVHHFGRSGPVDRALVERMNALIRHRGPDEAGSGFEDGVGMAMSRLAIIDLATGQQPIYNADGTVWIVFNGEIYNFEALREELLGKGYVFKTRSDTEVIVHLYEEYGPDCVKKLRGMFAFSIWDRRNKRLLLARDRLGKKPLNYVLGEGRIAWASELRCLLELPGVSRELDPGALDLYLSLQYIPSPRTIYKNIHKLPPAHRLVCENGKVKVERYWDLPAEGPGYRGSFEDAKTDIRAKLSESTRLRMISEVPLGAFLSGGIDSSAVVAAMARLSERPVKTFSIGFDEAEFSELHYARQVAKMYGTEHTEFVVQPKMAEILPKLAWHYGEPYADASALPTYYVSRETRRHVTVALNGDGGDENFAGYLRYMAMKLAHYWDYLPGPAQKALAAGAGLLPERNAPVSFLWRVKRFAHSAVFGSLPQRHLKMVGYFFEEDKKGVYSDGFKAALGPGPELALRYLSEAYERAPKDDFVNKLLYVDIATYLPECLMTKVDIASMANSLEGRSPLLDHEFMELVWGMPGRWKLKGVRGMKHLFKEAVRQDLPPAIYRRGKMGFGIPLGPWFRGELRDYWRDHVLSSKALSRGWFREEGLRRLFDEHQSGKRDHGYRLWALLMLELWHESCEPGGGLA